MKIKVTWHCHCDFIINFFVNIYFILQCTANILVVRIITIRRVSIAIVASGFRFQITVICSSPPYISNGPAGLTMTTRFVVWRVLHSTPSLQSLTGKLQGRITTYTGRSLYSLQGMSLQSTAFFCFGYISFPVLITLKLLL